MKKRFFYLGLLAALVASLSGCPLFAKPSPTITLSSPYAGYSTSSATIYVSGNISFTSAVDQYDVKDILLKLTYNSTSGSKTYSQSYSSSSSYFNTNLSVPSDAASGNMTLMVTVQFYDYVHQEDVSTSVTLNYIYSDYSAPSFYSAPTLYKSSISPATSSPTFFVNSQIYLNFSATDNRGVTKLAYCWDSSSGTKTDVPLDSSIVSSAIYGKTVSLLKVPSSLFSGSHTLYVYCGDASSNYSSYYSFAVTISAYAIPIVDISDPGDDIVLPSGSTSYQVYASVTPGTSSVASAYIALDSGSFQAAKYEGSPSTLWSCVFTDLSEGMHTLKAYATDTTGVDSATDSSVFYVDNTAPNVPTISVSDSSGAIASGGVSTAPSYTITVTASDAANGSGIQKVVLKINGNTALMTQSTTSSDTWTYTNQSPTNGKQTISATATDKAGLSTSTSSDFFFTKSMMPTVTMSSPTVSILYKKTTDLATPLVISGSTTVAGTGIATLSSVMATVGGSAALASPSVTVSGADWSFSLGNALEEGIHLVTVTATDSLGKQASASFTIYIDNTPPTVSALDANVKADNPSNQIGSSTYSGSITMTGSASDSLSGIQNVFVSIDDGFNWAATLSGNDWTYKISNLSNGTHTIKVKALDKSGNYSSYTTLSTITYVPQPTLSASVTQSTVFSATINVNPAATFANSTGNFIQWAIDSPSYGTDKQVAVTGTSYSTGIPVTLPSDGRHTIYMRAKDSYGFTSADCRIYITLDTSAPQIAITSPVSGQALSSYSVSISGTVTDTSLSPNNDALRYMISPDNGTTWPSSWTSLGNSASWSFTYTAPQDGQYQIKLRAYDSRYANATLADADTTGAHWTETTSAFTVNSRPYLPQNYLYSYTDEMLLAGNLYAGQVKWYSFTANSSTAIIKWQDFYLDSGSSFTAKLKVSIYSGNPDSSPVKLGTITSSSGVQSLTQAGLTPNTTYWIAVEPVSAGTGTYKICVCYRY